MKTLKARARAGEAVSTERPQAAILSTLRALREAVDGLKWREQIVLRLRHGLGAGWTLSERETSRTLGLPVSCVREIEAGALRRLVRALESRVPARDK
jgi:DNA-directed RNA polymerase sigma subunit (sigma70/sigma32)